MAGSHEPPVDFYDATYGHFGEALYAAIRAETWDQDIGQNGWITAAEQDEFARWLALGPGHRVLDVACGSGGPALRLAERTGAHVMGVDIQADAVEAGRREALARGLADRASFEVVDGSGALPMPAESVDAVLCIDAINHLGDRAAVLAEWARVLRPGGRVLFTDPAVVTGPLTSGEIALRSSIGPFLFVPPDANERLLREAGLRPERREDRTEAVAQSAARWHAARQKRAAELASVEGGATFEGQQRFLEVAAQLAAEGRLSRIAHLAAKPGEPERAAEKQRETPSGGRCGPWLAVTRFSPAPVHRRA